MNDFDDVRRRLLISNLQAKRELCEMERIALMREIQSPLTPQDRIEEAVERRVELRKQCEEITARLDDLGDWSDFA